MGVILSRFRKKKSTMEVLESLEKDIKNIEEYGQTTERRHKAVVGRLVLFSVGLYVLTACLFYFFFFPASLYDQLLYVIPLLLFPVIIVFVKRLVSWWYRRRISRNQEKLSIMKKQKKELLEEVMDKETYKIARHILERFAPEHLRRPNVSSSTVLAQSSLDSGRFSNQLALSQRNVSSSQTGSSGTELRRRVGVSTAADHVGQRQVVPLASPIRAAATASSPRVSAVSSSHLSPSSSSHVSSSSSSSSTGFGPILPSESTTVIPTDPGVITVATDSFGTNAASVGTATAADAASVTAAGDKPDADAEEKEENIDDDDDDDDDENKDETGKDTSTGAEVADDIGEKHMDEGPRKGIPAPQILRLTRPILPRERSVMDRLVEYIVGDGLTQRYALICRSCNSHNGMALKEEFEFLAFRCCYCSHWNPARKQRLQAPRLEAPPSSGNTTTTSSSPAESNTEEEDSSPEPNNPVPHEGQKENKSESHVRNPSSSSSEEINPANAESAESPSSTEVEFESLFPDSTVGESSKEDSPSH